MPYDLAGTLVEICDCNVICPCWVGQDPDNEQCHGAMAWKVESGKIDGVDVSGLTLAVGAELPGNALQGNWRVALYIDERANEEQEKALIDAFSGKKGGALADLAQLIGQVVATERVPIACVADEGKTRLKIGDAIDAAAEPLEGATGRPTTMTETVFSSIPGAPAYASKSTKYRHDNPKLGIDLDISGRSAVHTPFRYQA